MSGSAARVVFGGEGVKTEALQAAVPDYRLAKLLPRPLIGSNRLAPYATCMHLPAHVWQDATRTWPTPRIVVPCFTVVAKAREG